MFYIIKANYKKQLGSFIGILMLNLIITVSFCTVAAIWINSGDYELKQLERIGYGEISSWVNKVPDMEELLLQIQSVNGVEKVTSQSVIYCSYCVNGKESTSNADVYAYLPQTTAYYFYKNDLSDRRTQVTQIESRSCYVSPAFCSLFNAVIGDELILHSGSGKDISYRIAGFYEDPVAGSSMMGVKDILLNAEDFSSLEQTVISISAQNSAASNSGNGAVIHIFQKEDSTYSPAELQNQINENTNIQQYTIMTYSKANIQSFMLILQNIFSGFLILFVVVLFIVTMIVLGHSISNSIEQDFVDLGIMKATGYTTARIRRLQLYQYLLVIGAGMLAGIPLALPVIHLIGRVTVTVTGIMFPVSLPIGTCLLILLAVLLISSAYICIKTQRISCITPIRAIRGGKGDVYFKSRLRMPIYAKGLDLSLAYRQLVSGKKQYISTCIITAFLVFFFSLAGRIGAWVGPDGEGMMQNFGASSYDIGVYAKDSKLYPDIENVINESTDILASYQMGKTGATLEGMDYTLNIISDPSQYHLLQGNTCNYPSEIVVTEFIAEDMGLTIGDTVKVGIGNQEKKYIISGIYQCANDMGANFGMSIEGFEQFNSEVGFYVNYQLMDASAKQEIKAALQDKFGTNIHIDQNTWSGIDGIVTAMNAIQFLMYVIEMIFIMVTISMTGYKILNKEQQDLGIYKSLGFASLNLRLMFALRFGIVAIIGSIIGNILSSAFTDPLAESLLRKCGISFFHSHLSLVQVLWSSSFVVILFVIFSFLASWRIRKVNPIILIVE